MVVARPSPALTTYARGASVSMTTDLILDSLQRRMRRHALALLPSGRHDGSEHVNHFEREGVLPIAFSLFHYTNMEDVSFMMITGVPPVWNDDWQEQVHVAVNDHGKHRTVDEMVDQRIGDYDAFKAYQREVFERTEAWLDVARSGGVDRVVIPRPLPRPGRPAPTAPAWRGPRASRCWTPPSAGSTSTACATWARSSWPGASSASAA